jgi:hypothetical protein
MSFLTNNYDSIPNRYPLQTAAVIDNANSGGSSYTSGGGSTGRQFTTSGTLIITTGGTYTALTVAYGKSGSQGTGAGFGSTYDSAGNGGNGGACNIYTGYISQGNYTVNLPLNQNDGDVTLTNFFSSNVLSSFFNADVTNYTQGSGGYGERTTAPTYIGIAGSDGPILPAPFNGFSVGGGGGGGGGGNYGRPSVGRTGGLYSGSATVVNAASTSYGSGGGGGKSFGFAGGLGGPALFVFMAGGTSISNISNTSMPNMLVNTNFTLSNLLDNYYTIGYKPNTSLVTLPVIPSISTYSNNYKVDGTSITTALSYKRHPFTITAIFSSNISINWFNGYYTIIFTNNNTYTITFSSSIMNLVAYVCSAGGNGGDGFFSAIGGYGYGGASGIVTTGTLTSVAFGIGLNCYCNQSNSYKVQYNTDYISATNGTSSVDITNNSALSGLASVNGTSFTNTSYSIGDAVTRTFRVTITIASPAVVTWTGHNLVVGDTFSFNTTGTLPTGITAGTTYFIKTVVTANTLQIALTSGGTAINTTGVQSGTHMAALLVTTVGISVASPAVVSWTANGFGLNDTFRFTTTGALPTGVNTSTIYFVKSILSANQFNISTTPGGVAINTSGTQSGVHKAYLPLGSRFGTTTGGYTMYTDAYTGIGFGGAGAGAPSGKGGMRGFAGGSSTVNGVGYGAGGAGGNTDDSDPPMYSPGAGALGVIILSFPWA